MMLRKPCRMSKENFWKMPQRSPNNSGPGGLERAPTCSARDCGRRLGLLVGQGHRLPPLLPRVPEPSAVERTRSPLHVAPLPLRRPHCRGDEPPSGLCLKRCRACCMRSAPVGAPEWLLRCPTWPSLSPVSRCSGKESSSPQGHSVAVPEARTLYWCGTPRGAPMEMPRHPDSLTPVPTVPSCSLLSGVPAPAL